MHMYLEPQVPCITLFLRGTKFSQFSRFLDLSQKLILQKCCHTTSFYVSTWVIREIFLWKFNATYNKQQKHSNSISTTQFLFNMYLTIVSSQ